MKVLVVEDGRTTRLMLKSAVEQLGHQCLTAADGTEAWDLFRLQGADVIISDWLIPASKDRSCVGWCATTTAHTPISCC